MIERTAVDLAVLPAAMLAIVKAHCRVEHARDDALLTGVYIPSSIRLVESKCNVSLNPATYIVTADELRYGRGLVPGWWLPLNNVHTLTVSDDAADITADYTLGNQDFGGNTSSYVYPANETSPPVPCGALLTLEVGVDDPTVLAPAFLSLILRLTASMYENREASADLWGETFDEEAMTMWRPAA